ncbi:unnamed protein product [Allacma fusca]|uniref:Uncharacterized protein n=1 Tax=Allacma fusca TaxID=39272 RepID=A0A8J2KN40_9HEXA|nr:unnamed protein product [Allacma fusca]
MTLSCWKIVSSLTSVKIGTGIEDSTNGLQFWDFYRLHSFLLKLNQQMYSCGIPISTKLAERPIGMKM